MKPTPDPFDNPLFSAVQRSRALGDSKTFVDSTPLAPLAAIVDEYLRSGIGDDPQRLRTFVESRFALPRTIEAAAIERLPLAPHIDALWKLLRREPEAEREGSTLIALERPTVVPGGRFREGYYWDSYFTMLGLLASGEVALARDLVNNCAHLIRSFGFVPNGNRTYYLSRSQPPVFALMVQLLVERDGDGEWARFIDALVMEHRFWTGSEGGHTVPLSTGGVLCRYFDPQGAPRPESHAEDIEWASRCVAPAVETFRHIRSAAESGWDFSSRWFREPRDATTIHTTEILPVDLNCLVYRLEEVLATAHAAVGDFSAARNYRALADARGRTLQRLCWSTADAYFVDFDFVARAPTRVLSLAGVLPLVVGIATRDQAAAVARQLEDRFLHAGGLITTLEVTGQQWDAPNGWAPLHWWATCGLENYGYNALAREIARRWVTLNRDVFARTGRLMEKYDVVDPLRPAGGGEYPNQDGFGWTNAVLRQFAAKYGFDLGEAANRSPRQDSVAEVT